VGESDVKERFVSHLASELDLLRAEGLFKSERVIRSPQSGEVELASGSHVLNF
jgi:glycine C-acetyltransferase